MTIIIAIHHRRRPAMPCAATACYARWPAPVSASPVCPACPARRASLVSSPGRAPAPNSSSSILHALCAERSPFAFSAAPR